jgi:hypothetical protein
MNYVVYDKQTGNILRTGSCPREMANIQSVGDNEAILEGEANDALDLVDTVTKAVRREGKRTRQEYEKMKIDTLKKAGKP